MEAEMENDDAAAQQPVADEATTEPTSQETQTEQEPVVETAPAEGNQEPSQEEAPEPQNTNEGAEAPAPEEEEEPASDPDFSQYSYQPKYDLPLTEDGSVDPVAFANQIQQQTLAQVRFEQKESRDWGAIEKKFEGQLTPTRRQMILNARIANAVEGKQADLKKVASEIMKEFGVSKSEGRAEATTSRKVQKAASLETATANSGGAPKNDTMDRIANGDKGAAAELLAGWLDNGTI